MAETGRLKAPASAGGWSALPLKRRVLLLRVAIIVTLVVVWEAVAASGLLFRDVVPSLVSVGKAMVSILTVADHKVQLFGAEHVIPEFYRHLWVTIGEVMTGLVIGGFAGLAVGLLLGANPFLSAAFERFLYYLGPAPKIIFFPLMIMWFGVGPGSKVAMGTISCFFPVVLSVASGVRQIDKVLIRVGRSFRVNTWQMVTKIYLPAMRAADHQRRAAGARRGGDRHAACGDQAVQSGHRLPDHQLLHDVRHAAHVRAADPAVRRVDRGECAGRPSEQGLTPKSESY